MLSLKRVDWKRRTPAILVLPLLGALACVGELPDEEPAVEYEASSYLPPGSAATVCNIPAGLGLNLRSAPNTQSTILAVLKPGAQVTVLAGSGSWYRVQAVQAGWASGSFLCLVGGVSSGGAVPSPAGTCTGGFSHPAPGYPVTSEFGSCRDGCTRKHAGIDLGTPSGTIVRAADGGQVDYASWVSGYGYMIDVLHCGKHTTRYAHLSQFLVKPGQWVRRGDPIARSGNSGVGTGPHLHFEIRIGGPYGAPVNPRHYVAF